MLFANLAPITRTLSLISRRRIALKCRHSKMCPENLSLIDKRKRASFRLCNVSGYKTDLLEIHAKDPKFHVLFIPGNPGVVSFYVDFLESLYDLLDGTASVTAISHVGHTEKNWEHGRLFSLQEQTDHKMNFIEHELQDAEVPIVLVGHSIGSYISLDIVKRLQGKVTYCIFLYPFIAVNTKSSTQAFIKKISASRTLCTGLSSIVAILGLLPAWISRILVKNSVGNSWCPSAVEALCTHVLKYHTVQNMLYMAMTEFEKISSKVPGAVVALEGGDYTHAFSCTDAGSLWVAQHVSTLIKNYFSKIKFE
ncbi:uncharacterized protein LOC132625893 isoform X3 [Lycium barbarum]|uniref:uncharacterized protein LOC132625893 isoform X3 n=1 Tax=Lycium barbarum TaxID=112863 RepID=UPI00293F0FF7|nr:uncharacterized protein LOC132625893 isoform X3 [Lycium barbarum]